MDNAGLDLGPWEDRGDRVGKALQAVNHGNENVLDAAVAQFVHDPEPELRALRLLDPEAEDILIAVVDGLKGFPEAIGAVFPRTQVQACIVHLIRNSLSFVSWKDRKAVAAALKEIYRARNAETGQAALDAFDAGPWGRKYPVIAQSWRRNWAEVIPFYAFPDQVRRIIYTTNAIEAVNAKLRRAVRARGHFPTDDAALKLLFLVLNRVAKEWKMPAREWTAAKAQFAILFEDRFIAT